MPPPDAERIDWRRAQRFLLLCATLILIVVAIGAFYYALLLPILLSAFFSYLLLPLVARLERRRVRRSLAACLLILSSVAAVIFAVVKIVPALYTQVQLILKLVPTAVNTVVQTWLPSAEAFVNELGLMKPEQVHQYIGNFNIINQLGDEMRAGLAGLWSTGASLAGGVVNVVLVPFLMFFLLNDYPRMASGCRRLVPRDLVVPLHFVLDRVNVTLRTVIKSQAIVAAILAVLYAIGLSAVGLTSAVAIGAVAGICRLIPYFDVIVGGILSAIVLLSDFHGWGQVLSVAIVFVVVQALDGAFITPRVIGERVGLHPIVVVLSVMAFANWLGFWGVLLAIPLVAIAKALISAAEPFYLQSKAYGPIIEAPSDSGT